MKLVERELGSHHVSCDIGCHLFSILPPFNIGATTMGYGLGPASNAAFNVKTDKKSIAMIGDGGFWHNGLTSSIGNAVYKLASRCGADGKTVADNFKTGVRHLNTHVNRIASSSSPTTARIAIDDIDRDLEEIAGNLQHVANVPECSPDSTDDDKDASKSE